MIPNLGALTIKRVCIHTIHQKTKAEKHSSVDFGGGVVVLDDEVKDTITERLATYCGDRSRAFELKIAKVQDGSFYAQAVALRAISDDEDFVTATKAIAQLLAESQRRGNIHTSSLFLLDAIDEHANAVVVCVKAEGTDALTHDSEGGVSRLMQVKNLFMGRTEKFFKVGLIYHSPPSANDQNILPYEQWGALLYDHQFRTNTEPAKYFWDEFLGFSFSQNEKLMSKNAYDAMTRFVESHFGDDVTAKSDILDRLDDHMRNGNINTIDFDDIKANIIPPDKQDDFNEEVQSVFTNSIIKDNALIERKLNQARMQFDKLVLRGPKEAFATRVDVIENEADLQSLQLGQGYTIIKIKGNPDRILRYAEPD